MNEELYTVEYKYQEADVSKTGWKYQAINETIRNY